MVHVLNLVLEMQNIIEIVLKQNLINKICNNNKYAKLVSRDTSLGFPYTQITFRIRSCLLKDKSPKEQDHTLRDKCVRVSTYLKKLEQNSPGRDLQFNK